MAITEARMLYGVQLHQLAAHILKNNEDAEECENDTYLKAWNTIPPQIPRYLYAYLAKICRNLSFDKLDWKKALKRNAHIIELTVEIESSIPSCSEAFPCEAEEIGYIINCFLHSLSKDNRLFFMRRYYFADSIQSIAERYDVSESKVKTSLFRSRNKLKIYLEKEGIKI